MVSGPTEPNSSTVPSAAALATNWCAMLPPRRPCCPPPPTGQCSRPASWQSAAPLRRPRHLQQSPPPASLAFGRKVLRRSAESQGQGAASARAHCSRVRFGWGLLLVGCGGWGCDQSPGQWGWAGAFPPRGAAAKRCGKCRAQTCRRACVANSAITAPRCRHSSSGRPAVPRAASSQAAGGGEQQGDEGAVHRLLRSIAMQRVAAQVQPPQASRANRQAHAANAASSLGRLGRSYRAGMSSR